MARLRQLIFCSFLVAPIIIAAEASAAELKRVDGKDKKTRIDLNGDIAEGDAEKLKAIVKEANDVQRVVATIRLNSPGGNLLEGVRLSEVVKYGRIATAVLSGGTCASACFIVFAAGSEKYAHYSARVGVHGASERGQETLHSGAATVTMARVVRDLGVPSGIVGKMVVTPPTDMVWLTIDDLRSMNVTMLGKPMQSPPPDQQVMERSPQMITPNAQASVPSSSKLTWDQLLAGAIEISKEQNNGKAKFARSCQPELKICNTGVWFRSDKGIQMFLRVQENLHGKMTRREVCSINDFGDVRTCVDWDSKTSRKSMKDDKGDWIGVDD
jgi:hypothetical protein